MAEHDDLNRRLKAADRCPSGVAHTESSRETLDAIRLQARSGPRETVSRAGWRFAKRGPRRLAVLASVLGVLVVGGAAAAATILTTYTGKYVTGHDALSIGPGQLMRIDAPDYCQAALKLSSDIPYPSGYEGWRTWELLNEGSWQKVTPSGSCENNNPYLGVYKVTTGAERGFFAMSAFCAWVSDWQAAESSGNTSEASNAASEIAGALKWPAVVAEDPHPAYPQQEQNGYISTFGWFIPLQNAVQSGDASQVSDALAKSNCPAYVPPAASDGGTVYPNFAQVVANARASAIANAKATPTSTTTR